MPTSAVTGTQSVKAGGAQSQPAEKSKTKPKAKSKSWPVDSQSGFHRTRNYTREDGTNVIQELWGKTWVDIEERPRTNG